MENNNIEKNDNIYQKEDSKDDKENIPLLKENNKETKIETKEEINNNKPSKSGGFTLYLLFISFTSILSSINFGYQVSVLNIPEESIRINCTNSENYGFFQPCVMIDDFQWTWLQSMMQISGLIGGIVAGPFADVLERKFVLFLNNINFITGSLFMSLFSSFWLLLIGRFLNGLGVGFASAVVPLYLNEISPTSIRGMIG